MLAQHPDPAGHGVQRVAEGVSQVLALVFRGATQDLEGGFHRPEPAGDGFRITLTRARVPELRGEVVEPRSNVIEDGLPG
jgi:hypothetical protein